MQWLWAASFHVLLLGHLEAIFFFPETSHGFDWVSLLYMVLHRFLPVREVKMKGLLKWWNRVQICTAFTRAFCFINHHILYSHKGVIRQFISQSGRDGGFSIAALFLRRVKRTCVLSGFISACHWSNLWLKGSHQLQTFAHASFFLMTSLSGSTWRANFRLLMVYSWPQ